MPSLPVTLEKVHRYFSAWSDDVGKLAGSENKIRYCRERIPEFLLNRSLIADILHGITSAEKGSDNGHRMLFGNEWLIHMDSRRRFSVRMYLHAPGDYTVVHDHSSWGVLGNPSGVMEIIKYVRQDDRRSEGYARLAQTQSIRCLPGQTDVTLPLDDGIHRVGNPSDRTTVIINIYGTPIRRLYINHFDLENHRVARVFPPRIKRRMLAADALRVFVDEQRGVRGTTIASRYPP